MRSRSKISETFANRSLPLIGGGLIAFSCLLPLGWLVLQILSNPTTLRLLHPSAIRWDILGRTCGYSAVAAVLATLLAIPPAILVGRVRGGVASIIVFVLPLTLLLPSITYAYGWAQFFRLASGPLGHLLVAIHASDGWLQWLGIHLVTTGPDGPVAFLTPTGPADAGRCIWSIATWLWPVPAGAMALAARRADPGVRQQALLDGAVGRVTARQMLTPGLVGALAVWVLAGQEFAVYEPTGISVVATEVRMVFETGSFSSVDNPITQSMGGAMFGGSTSGGSAPSPLVTTAEPQDVQQRAASAAVATAVPMLLLTGLFGLLVMAACRKWSAAADEVHEPPAGTGRDRASVLAVVASATVIAGTAGIPIAAMILRHHRPFRVGFVWAEFGDLLLGSLLMAGLAGLAAGLVGLAGMQKRSRWTFAVALASFLVGGQLLAIALIRLYNRKHMGWVYNAPPIMVAAYIGRFGWIALLAAAATWSRPWKQLRSQAAIDGATSAAAARHVIWPLAWPVMLASALLVLILSLTEVPATVLASPYNPPQIVPMLMTWVHTLESDPMIEASLMLAGLVFSFGAVVNVILYLSRRRWISVRLPPAAARMVLVALAPLVLLTGCGKSGEPEAVWLSTGTAPGQVVYPRALCYSESDDSFFVIDRMARVQHLDHKGNFLNGWQMPAWQFGKPVGVSVGPDGNVYVPDTHYHRVMVYSKAGEVVREWGSLGKEPGQFIYPTDIAFDPQGNIFVSEYGENDRIQVFSPAGKYLYKFGQFGEGDGAFSRPQSMVIRDGLVYVTDSCNHRLVVFKTDGTFVRNMGKCGSGLGEFRFPYGLDIDRDGRLVVCEFGNNRVQLVDRLTGNGIKTWGKAGRESGQLAYPWGVAVDKEGRVVAVDAGNNRLQVFRF